MNKIIIIGNVPIGLSSLIFGIKNVFIEPDANKAREIVKDMLSKKENDIVIMTSNYFNILDNELKEKAVKAFNGNPSIVPGEIEKLKAEAYSSLATVDHETMPHLWRLIELASDIADLSETLYKFDV